jgi:hypothetical protein
MQDCDGLTAEDPEGDVLDESRRRDRPVAALVAQLCVGSELCARPPHASVVLSYMSRHDEAAAAMRRARELDPLYVERYECVAIQQITRPRFVSISV